MPDEELAAKTEEHASALDAITTVVSVREEARSTINRALGLLFTTGGGPDRRPGLRRGLAVRSPGPGRSARIGGDFREPPRRGDAR